LKDLSSSAFGVASKGTVIPREGVEREQILKDMIYFYEFS
jgi:hypothetical protein